jgi:hypothetical protein
VAESKQKRATLSWQVNPEARAILEGLKEETGVPNTESLTRILEWFASLDRKFRLAVLNRDPATRAELARLTLEQWAAAEAAQPKPTQDLAPSLPPSSGEGRALGAKGGSPTPHVHGGQSRRPSRRGEVSR